MKRRTFLAQLACASASTSFLTAEEAGSSQGFKIGACDWTMRQASKPQALTLAKKIGLDGVEVDVGKPSKDTDPLPLSDKALQKEYLELSKRLGISIPSLAMGVLNQIPYKSSKGAEVWAKEALGICKSMNVSMVLMAFFGAGDLVEDPKGRDEVVKRLKGLAPMAEDQEVTFGIESRLRADVLIGMLEEVGSPNIQVYYDTGNMHKVGEDIYAAIPKLGKKRICQFHAKDHQDLYGKGNIDFPRVRKVMDAIDYQGWIMIEGTKMPLGIEESFRYDADYLRTQFPAKISK